MKFATFGLLLALSGFAYGFVVFPSLSPTGEVNLPIPHLQLPLRNIGFTLPGAVPSTGVEPLPVAAPPAEPTKRVNTDALIRAAAEKHRVPAAFIKSIVAAESNFDCDAISPKGAIGLMQLMPKTAEEYGVDPSIPEQNVDGGTRYLRVLMDRYHRHENSLKRVIAAYNAGPGNVDRYRGVPPFRETRGYVVRVLTFLRQFQREEGRGATA
jgi:soluble lytic murein transglycosylase-like protein